MVHFSRSFVSYSSGLSLSCYSPTITVNVNTPVMSGREAANPSMPPSNSSAKYRWSSE